MIKCVKEWERRRGAVPGVNDVVVDGGVVGVEAGRPRQVDAAGGEAHDERPAGRVGDTCAEKNKNY